MPVNYQFIIYLFFHISVDHCVLYSFPTRRSSDLFVLQTDGSGNTSWVAQSGGAGTVNAGTANQMTDRKSTRLNSSHVSISYAVFCLKKKIVSIRSCPATTLFHFITSRHPACRSII